MNNKESLRIADIRSDICLGCASDVKHEVSVLIQKLPGEAQGRKFDSVLVYMCEPCAEKKDINRLIKNFSRFILEGVVTDMGCVLDGKASDNSSSDL